MQKMRKKSSMMLLWAVILTLVFSMSYAPDVKAATSNVKSVTVTNASSRKLNLQKGKSITLKVKVTSTNKKKASQKVSFKSSNTKVATVSSKGKVTAKKNGTAKITVTSKANTKKKVVITVKVTTPAKPDANVKGVTVTNLPSKDLTLKKGKSKTVKVKVESTSSKKKVSQKVTYQSSNTKVATVSSKGKITAKKSGTAKITITSQANTKKKVTINVKVGTPVTGISLNQTQATIQTGGSLTLKATLKPKKPSNKTIIWSSSDPTVATVSNKGVVKALKAGTTKITATAADGSGKSKSATITVKNPVVVKEVAVVNAATVRVTLSEAQELAQTAFAVKSNKYGGSNYNKVNKVDHISTTDKITYLLVLDNRSRLSDRDNVQVTVTGLWGSQTSAGTTVFNDGVFKYTDEMTYTATVGERYNETFSGNGYGYKAFAVTNLPKGILYEELGNYIRFYGKPQAAGNVVTQVVVADEAGNTYTYAITWVIGTKDSITATVSGDKYYLVNASGYATIGTRYDGGGSSSTLQVRGHGGSGSYKYTLVGNTTPLAIGESDGYITGQVTSRGDYTLNVRVEDRENPAKATTATVVIHVEQSVTVSGMMKDLGGNPITREATIEFINKDKANKFGNEYSVVYNREMGSFTATLVSGTYDIKATCGAGNAETTSYLYSEQLTTSRSGFDVTLAVRRISISSDNNTLIRPNEFGTWEDAYGEEYGYGEWLYLKEGNYSLTTTMESRKGTITATVAVNTATPSAVAHVTVTNAPVAILVGQPVAVSLKPGSQYTYYTFTPAASGTYYFYSNGTNDTYGKLESAEGSSLISDDDGYGDNNFYFSYDCVANTTYYVGIRSYSSGEGRTATLYVSATDPKASNVTAPTYDNETAPVADDVVEEVITDETDAAPEAPAEDAAAADETTEPAVDDAQADETNEPETDETNVPEADETNAPEADETAAPADDETAGEESADVIPQAEEAPAQADETTEETPVAPAEEAVETVETL